MLANKAPQHALGLLGYIIVLIVLLSCFKGFLLVLQALLVGKGEGLRDSATSKVIREGVTADEGCTDAIRSRRVLLLHSLIFVNKWRSLVVVVACFVVYGCLRHDISDLILVSGYLTLRK